ncbi:unnamed protein product [Pocillopora meandrina]|uniref:Potassium channel domain-containing protein n=1 Tax=Pocillopora meandrina TaxID=46732 RepID=A0AAU9XJP0_9CNID|nr:unnamed protein product [Pocillopora meandrina]
MTTVGYGDKAPKSSLARVYASLWMIIGILLMSTITAQISSSITADGLRPLNDVFGSKVGVPLGSKKPLEKENHGFNMKEYRTERELLNGLIDGSVDAILLFDCGTVEMERQSPHLTIVDASEFNLSIRVGFAVEEGNENLEECLQDWTNEECSTEQTNADGDPDDEYEDWELSCFKEYSHGKYRHDMKQGSSDDRVKTHHFILMSSAGLFVIFLLTGSLRNACRKGRPTTDDVDIEKGVSHTKLRASITDAVPMRELSTRILHYETEQNTIENITN